MPEAVCVEGFAQKSKLPLRKLIFSGVGHGRQFPAFGDEPDRERVDAVAGILLREAFAFEDMAQVAPAVGADYLRATPVRVRMAHHASWEFVIEAGPAAP